MIKLPIFRNARTTETQPDLDGEAEPGGARVATVGLRYPWKRLVVGSGVVVLVGVLAAGLGTVRIPPLTVLEILVTRLPGVDITATWPDSWDTILWRLRLPRIVLAGIVGGSLAIAGATYQGLFRNPLAAPSLIGATAGAGLGATIVMVTWAPSAVFGVNILPAAAFAGAVAAVAVAYVVARNAGALPLTSLILAGVAVSALASAVTALLMIRSESELRPVLSWLLGGFISAQWKHAVLILPYLVPGAVVALYYGRVLNVLQLDEEHARQLGVNVETTKLLLIGAATLVTAAAVSFTGPIGFVGLIAPHAVRLAWGVDHRFLLPMAALVGAAFLILADLAARTVASPAELPVGVVTAFCGAPFFLYLLRRRQRAVM